MQNPSAKTLHYTLFVCLPLSFQNPTLTLRSVQGIARILIFVYTPPHLQKPSITLCSIQGKNPPLHFVPFRALCPSLRDTTFREISLVDSGTYVEKIREGGCCARANPNARPSIKIPYTQIFLPALIAVPKRYNFTMINYDQDCNLMPFTLTALR